MAPTKQERRACTMAPRLLVAPKKSPARASAVKKLAFNADSQAIEDIGNLLNKGDQFSDCTLVTSDGKEFKVYKGILACRSPVFAAMFEHKMVEANKGVVKIDDIKSAVLEQLLKFIYSGTATKLGEMAAELFAAADKYELEKLKLLCERELVRSICAENACELLVLADRHSAQNLKTKTFKFILKQMKTIRETEQWKLMVKGNHGNLLDEIIEAMARSK